MHDQVIAMKVDLPINEVCTNNHKAGMMTTYLRGLDALQYDSVVYLGDLCFSGVFFLFSFCFVFFYFYEIPGALSTGKSTRTTHGLWVIPPIQ